MTKKVFILLLITFSLFSCSSKQEEENKETKVKEILCEETYKIGELDKTNLKLKGVIISDENKNITSPISGVIDYLDCKPGKQVYSKTLIARVSPDFNNPNISNLLIQKSSLISQKTNIESLKQTTIANLDTQIKDVKEQIDILKKNIELTKKSSSLNKKDLDKQIESLENTLISLEENLVLLNSSKKEALEKLDISKASLLTNIKTNTSNNLLKIDEIFGITDENETLNDKYEMYLSAKDSKLLNELKFGFIKLNKSKDKLDDFSMEEISLYLKDLIKLEETAKDAIKKSVANVYFPQTQIDSLYTLFSNFIISITEMKNSWDSLENSRSSTITNFDTQISSLNNQINTSKTNLENLKSNKLDSVDTGLELQLSNLDANLKTLTSNLSNLESNKKTQIINFDNQILQLNQSISSLNSNLSKRSIYAKVTGIINQKIGSVGNSIGAGMSLCQITPNNKSIKIKIYSPLELNIGDNLTFELNGETYEVVIENALIYKDQVTQNYIYESNYLDKSYFKTGEIIELKYENKDKKTDIKTKKDLKIPVSYIENKIDGNFIKVKTSSGIIEKKVEIGDINGNFVEILSNIETVRDICK